MHNPPRLGRYVIGTPPTHGIVYNRVRLRIRFCFDVLYAMYSTHINHGKVYILRKVLSLPQYCGRNNCTYPRKIYVLYTPFLGSILPSYDNTTKTIKICKPRTAINLTDICPHACLF